MYIVINIILVTSPSIMLNEIQSYTVTKTITLRCIALVSHHLPPPLDICPPEKNNKQWLRLNNITSIVITSI